LAFLVIRYLFAGIVIGVIKIIMLSGKYQKGKLQNGHKQEVGGEEKQCINTRRRRRL
jgi:hypothetical protein